MLTMLGGIVKYSVLVVVILVLSHVIQVQNVTISQHVLNAMHSVSGYNPKSQADRITADISRSLQNRAKELDKISDSVEVTPTDQQALNRVIQNSQGKR